MRIAVGRWTKVGGRKKLLSPTHVLLLIEGEHGGNEPSGGLPVGANGCGASRAIASRRGVRWTTGFVSLARPALEQKLLLSTLQSVSKLCSSQRERRFRTSVAALKPWGTVESRSFERPSSN